MNTTGTNPVLDRRIQFGGGHTDFLGGHIPVCGVVLSISDHSSIGMGIRSSVMSERDHTEVYNTAGGAGCCSVDIQEYLSNLIKQQNIDLATARSAIDLSKTFSYVGQKLAGALTWPSDPLSVHNQQTHHPLLLLWGCMCV